MKNTPLRIQKGASFEQEIRVKLDGADYTALSTATIKGVIWIDGATTVTETFTVPAVTAGSNVMFIQLTYTETDALTQANYNYLVYLTTSDDVRYWVQRGVATMETGSPEWP